MAIHPALQGLAEITEQVPPIGHLHGVRCALPDGISIGAGTVTGDDLDPAVTPQQAESVPVSRSGRRSTTLLRSRSTRMVP